MEQTVIMALFNNAALLLVLSVIYEITYLVPIKYRRLQPVFNGLLISLICIAIMSMPFTLQPGVIYDTRSILISATALIFGPIPTLITVVVSAAYRISLGGPGIWPGLAVIISSALIGLAWRRWLNPKNMKWRWLNIYAMSTAVHVTMLFCMLLLPYPNSITVIQTITVPIMLIYPVASVILNLLLMRQQKVRGIQEQLKQSEERFRILFDKAPLGYQSLNFDGNFIDVNQQWLDTLGYSREEVIGKWFGDFLAPAYREAFRQRFVLFKSQGHIHSEFEMIHKSGKLLFIAFEGRIGYGFDGLFKQTHCILQDITEQKAAEDKLRESEEKYSSYIRNAPDGIFVVDDNACFLEVNNAATVITGYSEEELLSMNTNDITSKEYFDISEQIFGEIIDSGSGNGELQITHKNGSVRWVSLAAIKLSESRLLGFVSDITNKKLAEENLIYLGNHDFLTGLFNRRFFEEEIVRLNEADKLPLSIIIGDINGLKLINDSFGRIEGDRIIIETAKLLRGYCRVGDVLARTGGDEFSILMPNTTLETAIEFLHGIQNACNEYNKSIENEAYHINLSLGASTKETQDDDFIEVYKLAEDYMNQRKLLEKKSSHSAIISSIKATMLEKSHETEEHAERLSLLSRKIGLILHLSQIDLDHLELFATLHDIGKIGISEQILNKPGKLDENEWVEMKKHPAIGYRIAMSAPNLAPIAEYILCHHERWDGGGYPQKLAGEEIPLLSRILAVVDAYDAITQDRSYRKAMTHDQAIEEIRQHAGTQFDPHIAKVFIENVVNTLL